MLKPMSKNANIKKDIQIDIWIVTKSPGMKLYQEVIRDILAGMGYVPKEV